MATMPPTLRVGEKIRFVSPASTPEQDDVLRRAAILEGWGLRVDYGDHAFAKRGFLAGTDEQRLADLNAALRDPEIRAIFATRGGKGSYRIADRLDFDAVRRDPKFIVGFSDITSLHLSLLKNCGLVGIHGALMTEVDGTFVPENCAALRRTVMTTDRIVISSRPDALGAALTTSGTACGPLIGGNLSMVATAAGWSLPDLRGAVLLLEAVNVQPGQVDRPLTMLRKAGHLDGLAGVALGQFTGCDWGGALSVVDLLREHLAPLGVPILGGLPLGHEASALVTLIGAPAVLDAAAGTLSVR